MTRQDSGRLDCDFFVHGRKVIGCSCLRNTFKVSVVASQRGIESRKEGVEKMMEIWFIGISKNEVKKDVMVYT